MCRSCPGLFWFTGSPVGSDPGDPAAWFRPSLVGPGGGRSHLHPGLCWLCGSSERKHLSAEVCTLKNVFVKAVLVFLDQFSGVIGFIFVLELTAAVLAVVFQSQVREWINDFFLANVKAYRDDIDLQNLIDSLQRMVCCEPLMSCCSNRTTAVGLRNL